MSFGAGAAQSVQRTFIKAQTLSRSEIHFDSTPNPLRTIYHLHASNYAQLHVTTEV